jgi:hypothetical protein
MQLEWWAEQVHRLCCDYDMQAVVCDPSRPDVIQLINERLGWRRSRDMDWICRAADNRRKSTKSVMGGLDMVRWALDRDEEGLPRIFLVRDAHQCHPCPIAEKKNVTCLEQEIQSYVWAAPPQNKPELKPEEPDPSCADHACDAMRYAAMFLWRTDLGPVPESFTFPKDSLGDVLGVGDLIDYETYLDYYC